MNKKKKQARIAVITVLLAMAVITTVFVLSGHNNLPLKDGSIENRLIINGRPIYVVYISNESVSQWQLVGAGFLKTLVERAGGKFQLFPAELDAEIQHSQINDMLAIKPDVVIIKAVNSVEVVKQIKKLNEASIPVIALDEGPEPGAELLTYIGTVQTSMGKINAEFLSEHFKGSRAKVICIMGPDGTSIVKKRQQGFNAAAAQLGNIDVLAQEHTLWANDTSMRLTKNLLKQYPETNSIFVLSDCMLDGVLAGISDLGKNISDYTIVSIDGDCNGLRAICEGKVAHIAEHNSALHSDIAVKVIIDYFNGKPIPPIIEFEPYSVTKENLDDPKRWGNLDPNQIDNWLVLDHDIYVPQSF